jgi:hypothetical protein
MSKAFPVEVTDKAVSLYKQGKSMDSIAEILNVTKRSVANWIIKAGVPRRTHKERYNCERNALILNKMSEWNPSVSYIMGYTLADGSLDVLNPASPGVCYSCVTPDREILDNIKEYFQIDSEISFAKKGKMVRLRIYGKEIVEKFKSYGMMVRKTWEDYPFPEIPESSLPHFIRGQFDGNGCASKTRQGRGGVMHFLGSRSIVTSIRDFLHQKTGCKLSRVFPRPGHFAVVFGAKEDISKIYNYLYPEGEYMYLKRKKIKLQEILSK